MRTHKYRAWDEMTMQYIYVGDIDFVNGRAYGLPIEMQECQDMIDVGLETLESGQVRRIRMEKIYMKVIFLKKIKVTTLR